MVIPDAANAACWYCCSQCAEASSSGKAGEFSPLEAPIVSSESGSFSGACPASGPALSVLFSSGFFSSSSASGSVSPGTAPSAEVSFSSSAEALGGDSVSPSSGSAGGLMMTVSSGSPSGVAPLSDTCWGASRPAVSAVFAANAWVGMTPSSMTTERAMARIRFAFFLIVRFLSC